MPERQLRQRIRQALRRAFPGALVLGWPSNLWTGLGWPDLLFSEWPLLVGFEVKQGRYSHPTPHQISRHVELRKHHIPVALTHSPEHAVDIIQTLKEKLPMAFDPSLLAELEAALNEAPPEAEPTLDDKRAALTDIAQDLQDQGLIVPAPSIQEQADADQNAYDLANGTATVEEIPNPGFEDIKLDADAPAPDIEDLTAAIAANAEITALETESVVEITLAYVNTMRALQQSVDRLIDAIHDLTLNIDADSTPADAAPAPRRRTRRS